MGSLISGQAAGQGIDAGSIINGLGNGQQGGGNANSLAGSGQGVGDVGAELANQLQGDQNSDINQILGGLGGNGNGHGQGQGNNGVNIIEVKETIVQQINGAGAIKETIVQGEMTTTAQNEAQKTTEAAMTTAPPAAEGMNATVCLLLLISPTQN